MSINHLNAELDPICHLLALLGAHHILHVSGIRVKYCVCVVCVVCVWCVMYVWCGVWCVCVVCVCVVCVWCVCGVCGVCVVCVWCACGVYVCVCGVCVVCVVCVWCVCVCGVCVWCVCGGRVLCMCVCGVCVCVCVALVSQHAKRMRHTILSSLTCPALPYFFSHYLGKNIEHKICVLICSTTIARKLSDSRRKWARYDQKCVLVFM